jgi:hypothetical protein
MEIKDVAEENMGGVEGLTFNDDSWAVPLTNRAPRQAQRHHACAGARAVIAATIRSASAPTRPIEVVRGSTTLIPAK